MAVAFYTIYGVRQFDMSESTAGVLFALLTLSATVANPTHIYAENGEYRVLLTITHKDGNQDVYETTVNYTCLS